MEKLSCDLEQKQFVEEKNEFVLSGYASVFGNVDLHDDVVEKGAFAESLDKRQPLLLLNHDMHSLPIGRIEEVKEDDRGLKFTATMPKDDSMVRDRLAPQLLHGSLKGVSIGFLTKGDRTCNKTNVRYIEKADLFEISLVNMPANPAASVDNFKSFNVAEFKNLSDREREAHLRSLGMSIMLTRHIVSGLREAGDGSRVITGDESLREAGKKRLVIPDFAQTINQYAHAFRS